MYGPADVVMKKYFVENVNVSNVSDINSAIENATDVVKLNLQKNLTLTSPITVAKDKSVIMNLNGQTVTSNINTAFVVNGGHISIEGGEIKGSKRAVEVTNGGSAIIEGGTFTTTSEGQVMNARGEGSLLTINGGEFNSQETGVMAFDGGKIVVNDGIFNTIDNFAIGTNGTAGRGGNTIIINKCVINGKIASEGYEACGIYVANNDHVIVGAGTAINVHNGCGILMRAGVVEIKKGVQINLTSDDEKFEGFVGDNKTKMKQSGIIYHESANYPGKANMELIIEDGVTVKGINHSIEILSNETQPKVTIGKGTYSPAYPEN